MLKNVPSTSRLPPSGMATPPMVTVVDRPAGAIVTLAAKLAAVTPSAEMSRKSWPPSGQASCAARPHAHAVFPSGGVARLDVAQSRHQHRGDHHKVNGAPRAAASVPGAKHGGRYGPWPCPTNPTAPYAVACYASTPREGAGALRRDTAWASCPSLVMLAPTKCMPMSKYMMPMTMVKSLSLHLANTQPC